MADLPRSSSLNALIGGPSRFTSSVGGAPLNGDQEMTAEQLVINLTDPKLRKNTLLQLSKKQELFPDLAPLLWNSLGIITTLLQEVVALYPPVLTSNVILARSNHVCNVLALFQCLASHPETRLPFLHANVPVYVYPFLNTTSNSWAVEHPRLTSLDVVGALVKVDDREVISFLQETRIVPLCLRAMETGSVSSKTVATFILTKILLDDVGLGNICSTVEQFSEVAQMLEKILSELAKQPSPQLLKHIIRCYLRLSDHEWACDALANCLPGMVKDATFSRCFQEDPITRGWYQQLLYNVGSSILDQQTHRGYYEWKMN